MGSIGAHLKSLRTERGLSLKAVYNECGISDSRLSRIEHGEANTIDPEVLRSLARFYNVDVISLLLVAGYLDESDLKDYQFRFKNVALLDDEELQGIQTMIDLLTRERQVSENDI